MPELCALLCPRLLSAGFLTPVFRDPAQTNAHLVQVIDQNDRVLRFVQAPEVDTWQSKASDIAVDVGASAIWAFRADELEIVGDRSTVADALAPALANGVFAGDPLLESEVALFCSDTARFVAALVPAFEELQRFSQRSAVVWRDASVLLPTLREALLGWKPHLVKSLRNVHLHMRDGEVTISVPGDWTNDATLELVDCLEKGAPLFRTFRQQASTFGADTFKLEIVQSRGPAPALRPKHTVVGWGVCGTAKHVLGKAAASGVVYAGEDGAKASVGVTIASLNGPDLALAAAMAKHWRANAMAIVGIVMLPPTFGVESRSLREYDALQRMRDRFDHVIVIGNHTLLKPNNVVSASLASWNRGVKFARSAIRAIVRIAETGDDPREQLMMHLGTSGYCIIGRSQAYGPLPKKPLELGLFGSLLNEHLLWWRAERISVFGDNAAANIDAGRAQSARVLRNPLEFIFFDRLPGHAAATALCSGIKLHVPTPVEYHVFVRNLVLAIGGTIIAEETSESIDVSYGGREWRLFPVQGSTDAQRFRNAVAHRSLERPSVVVLSGDELNTNFRPVSIMVRSAPYWRLQEVLQESSADTNFSAL